MCPDGVMVQEKVCLNQCTAAFVCGEVMVNLGKRRKKDEAYLDFSGTTEGRELAEFLRNRQVDVIVSVATEYGRDCMDVESSSNVSVRTGRMDEAQIRQFLTTQKIDLVVDATHPFAAEVTKM